MRPSNFIAKQRRLPKADASVVSGDDLFNALRQYELSPFLDVLEEWMRHAPSGAAIQRLAETMPQLWVTSLVSLARLGGYTERREVVHSGRVDLRAMSDTELEAAIVEKTAALGLPAPPTIEGEVSEQAAELQGEQPVPTEAPDGTAQGSANEP